MKKPIIIFSLLFLFSVAHSQEMESLIFNLEDIHLNMRPDSSNGSSQINLTRFGDYRQAQVNFKYWYEDYSFEPFLTGGNAEWHMGVNGGEYDEGDFSIENQRLSFDLSILRRDFIIREDNGYVGIGMFNRPEARLHVDHISQFDGDVPAFLVGSPRFSNSYMTVHKPKFDQNDGIAQFAENGSSTVYINGPSAFCQIGVNGRICANSYYSYPVIVIGLQKLKSAGSVLDKIKVATNLKSHDSVGGGIGIDIESLRSLAPSLIGQTESIQDDDSMSTEVVINYTGLIPILIAGHQEQTREFESAKREIEFLKEKMEKLELLLESKL